MKKKINRTIFLFCSVFLLLSSTCFAVSAPVKRIAILPTTNQTRVNAPEIETYCNGALRENLRVPLNSILNVHEYVPTTDIIQAMPEQTDTAWTSRLKDMANALNADLVVGFVITDLDEVQQHSWGGDLLQYTHVSIQLVGYDRARDSLLNFKRHEYFHDEFSPSGSLMSLSQKATRYLLNKADFKKDIFPLSTQKEAKSD